MTPFICPMEKLMAVYMGLMMLGAAIAVIATIWEKVNEKLHHHRRTTKRHD